MRKPIVCTTTITVEMYAMLLDCCGKYYNNIAWKFPEECKDGHGCCGLNFSQFFTHIKYDIPTLYKKSGDCIGIPEDDKTGYDQYALLDFIEYVGQYCRDIKICDFHSYFGHYHIDLLKTDKIFETFRAEINDIFTKTGLLYTLTANKIIERVLENSVLAPEIETAIQNIKEPGTKELLETAIVLFKQPDPIYRRDAVEKLWDAFERMKTYYTNLKKDVSADKIVNDISGGQTEFKALFDTEFRTLTKIGNDFRIRHHETDRINVIDHRHYDYFFNRCLALLATALQYLR